MDGQTDGWTDGRKDRVIPIYPQTLFAGGIKRTKGQTMVCKTLYRKLKTSQYLIQYLAESLNLRFEPGFNFIASDIFFIKTITEHAHNLYRMSSNLRSIAYDLHYCPGYKNYRRQNKMTFSPELYIVALKK